MDATRRTTAGVITCAALIVAAFALGRCSAPAAASAPPPEPIELVTISWDHHAATAQALEQLDAWVQSTTTTTRITPRVMVEPNYDPGDGSRWDQLAQCETGGNWATNTGNGFGGGLQFAHQPSWSTWLSFGGGEFAPHPWEASREQQIAVAERVLASSGWGAWPGCTRKFGWR